MILTLNERLASSPTLSASLIVLVHLSSYAEFSPCRLTRSVRARAIAPLLCLWTKYSTRQWPPCLLASHNPVPGGAAFETSRFDSDIAPCRYFFWRDRKAPWQFGPPIPHPSFLCLRGSVRPEHLKRDRKIRTRRPNSEVRPQSNSGFLTADKLLRTLTRRDV